MGRVERTGGNDVETASVNNTRSFAGKGNKEIDIGWDMKLKRFLQIGGIKATSYVNGNDPVKRGK